MSLNVRAAFWIALVVASLAVLDSEPSDGLAGENLDVTGNWSLTLDHAVQGPFKCALYLRQEEDASLVGGIDCQGQAGQLFGVVESTERTISLSGNFGTISVEFDGTIAADGEAIKGTWVNDLVPGEGSFNAVREESRWGDVNEDGAADAGDALLVLQGSIFGFVTVGWGLGDVNVDDRHDSLDALLILQFDAQLLQLLPVLP